MYPFPHSKFSLLSASAIENGRRIVGGENGLRSAHRRLQRAPVQRDALQAANRRMHRE
jgi:hypothetical protein